MIMTPEEKYRDLYEQMYELCDQQGWGDPFSYARSRDCLLYTSPSPRDRG